MSDSDNQAEAEGSAATPFEQLVEGYRYELFVHCYRMLGSVEDAEDALQDALVRAWRRRATLKVQSSLRAWLYKIATNVSLDMIQRRKTRTMPTLTHPNADPDEPPEGAVLEPLWLDPLPETYLDRYVSSPEAQYEALEHVSLAFLVALQRLPGRQRAILILSDVLDWHAQEIAAALNVTPAAVNSALQRARATLTRLQTETRPLSAGESSGLETAALLTRYVRAWEAADIASLIALLREDAVLTMPPLPTWLRGRSAIAKFLERYVFAGHTPGHFRLTTTHANNSPAFALYRRDENGTYQLAALHILTIIGDEVAAIDDFLAVDQELFTKFNLPRPD